MRGFAPLNLIAMRTGSLPIDQHIRDDIELFGETREYILHKKQQNSYPS